MGRVVKGCFKQLCAVGQTFWALALWIALNAAVFWRDYMQYKDSVKYFYLRKIIGRGLCISRASAAVLNINCCILLLPMCRLLNILLHHALSQISHSALTLWLRKGRSMHILCAGTIMLVSVIHTVAHFVNAYNFSHHYDEQHLELNWAKYSGESPVIMIFTSVVGVTGIIMVVVLALLFVTSLKWVRQKHYQIFWTMHHLYLIFFIALLCHPLSGKLKETVDFHHFPNCNKTVFYNKSVIEEDINSHDRNVANIPCHTSPTFVAMKSECWIWILPPLGLFIFDHIYWSVRRNSRQLKVIEVKRMAGNTIHLELQAPSTFFCRPGQYALLQCPVISSLEWHPFSIISCNMSQQPSLSFLIRAKGDWTENLLGRVLVPFSHSQHITELCNWPSKKPIMFLVDGPFRSPMEDILHCNIAVCIAAGIGITPFIATFRHLLTSTSPKDIPERLHVIWIFQDFNQLQWCAQLLCDLHEKFWYANQPDKLEIKIHITRDISNNKIQEYTKTQFQLLAHRIWGGRPHWLNVFTQLGEMYRGCTVHTFVCGPKSLIKDVRKHSQMMTEKGVQVKLLKEMF